MENISHFICRMLYCQEEANHETFISMEKRILEGKLWRELADGSMYYRKSLMNLLKKILGKFREMDSHEFNISMEEWERLGPQIHFYNIEYMEKMEEFAKLPFEMAEQGIRKRRSFIFQGFVYVPLEPMVDIILSHYEFYLKKKL